jgi:hypothetical protein
MRSDSGHTDSANHDQPKDDYRHKKQWRNENEIRTVDKSHGMRQCERRKGFYKAQLHSGLNSVSATTNVPQFTDLQAISSQPPSALPLPLPL